MAEKKSRDGKDRNTKRQTTRTSKLFDELRENAERKLKFEKTPLRTMSIEDAAATIHELQVQQVELKMQNEELRRTQVELEESRSKYTDLFDFAPVGYFVLDAKGLIVEVNLTGSALIGFERTVLNKSLFVLHIGIEYRESFSRHFRDVLKTAAQWRCEVSMRRKDKSEFFAGLIMDPVKDAEGNVIQCRIAIADISQRKRAERELVESRERLKLVTESGGAGTWDWDVQAKQVMWNERLYEMLGLSQKKIDLTPETFYHHIHPHDLPRVKEHLAKELKSGTEYEDTFRIVRGDSEIRWLSCRGRIFRDDDNKPIRMMGVNYDITDRKLAEEAVRRSEEKFHGLFTTMNEAFVLFELIRDDAGKVVDCRVLEANPSVEKMTGIAPPEAIGRTMKQIFPETDEYWFDIYGKVEKTGKPVTFERQFKPLNRFYNISIYRPAPEQIAIVFTDIDDKKLAEEQIRNLAKFPAENPFPVLRLSGDGTILYSNAPGQVLLEEWDCQTSQKAPDNWCRLISKALQESRMLVEQIQCSDRIFSFTIAPVSDGGYVNLYGRDITLQEQVKGVLRKSRDQLDVKVKERTSELAQTVAVLQREIEQRKRAEHSLWERSRDLDAFFSHTITPMAILDRKFNFVRVNKAYAEASQRDISEFAGHNHFEFYPHEENEQIFKKVVRTKTQYHVLAKPFSFPDHPEWGVTYWDWTLVPVFDEAGKVQLLVLSLKDVTESERTERRKDVTNFLLALFAQKTLRKEYLDSVVEIIRGWSGCKCVGIRITNDDGHIPYESSVGFSEEFLSLENDLSLHKDACVCIRVITQTPERQEVDFLTVKGSFHCGNSFSFVDSLSEDEKKQNRGNCPRAGFASVAIVPIRYREKILGAIHLADENQNKVPIETVEFLEDMAFLIGEAVHRFNVEQALRLSESKLVEAQRIAHLGNWEWDIVNNTLWWSDEVYRIFGLKPRQFKATYDAFLSCVHPDDRELVEAEVNKALYSHKTYSIIHRIIRPDDTERTVHERAKVLFDEDKKPIRMMGTVQDITEFKQAEERILADQEALRSMASELQLVEERERRRLACDLHDSLGQILAMSKRELVCLQKSAPAETADSVKMVTSQLDQAVKEVRTLSFELSPSVLYDLGFEVAVEDLTERFSRDRKIKCRFENSDQPKPLEEAIAVLLYRSVRELLINVAKHADATMIKVSLERVENKLQITVEDNGNGFDVSVLDGLSRQPRGFGIMSIRERLRHIGGHFDIQSGNGVGTKVTLIVPTHNQENIE